jgi:solute carrier family 35 protein C2
MDNVGNDNIDADNDSEHIDENNTIIEELSVEDIVKEPLINIPNGYCKDEQISLQMMIGKMVSILFNHGKFIFFYFLSSIGLTLFIKYNVSVTRMGYPLLLLSLQHAFNFALCSVFLAMFRTNAQNACNIHVPQSLSWSLFKQIIPFGVLTGLEYSLSNSSFFFISITLYTMVKCSSPIFVMLTSFVAGIEKVRKLLMLAIILISLGVGMAAAGSVDFKWSGFLLVLIASVISGFRLVYVQILLQKEKYNGEESLNSFEIYLYYAPVLSICILPFALILEGPRFASDYPSLAINGSLLYAKFLFLLEFLIILIIGALLGLCLNISEFLLIQRTSSLTYTVIGTIKELLVIGFSVKIFGDKLTIVNLFGFCVSIIGVIIFKLHKFSIFVENISTDQSSGHVEQDEFTKEILELRT